MYKNALQEDLIRVVEDLDGTVESTDTIAKLKTKIEVNSTFESDADFVKTLIKNCIDERVSRNERQATLENQKILCKKKDGNLRICIDYRKINSKTDKDRYPLPLIEEVLDQLQSGNFFSTIDSKN
ncbi:transposon Tf2-9 polyprotein [Trichonephila clavipes]|nr:transposon Tf2-9 polyprotein [Trichonephila clavipes]